MKSRKAGILHYASAGMKRINKHITPEQRERLIRFEMLRGLIRVPIAIYVAVITVTNIEMSIKVVFLLGAACVFIEGLRDIFVNPVKQAINRKRLIAMRQRRTSGL